LPLHLENPFTKTLNIRPLFPPHFVLKRTTAVNGDPFKLSGSTRITGTRKKQQNTRQRNDENFYFLYGKDECRKDECDSLSGNGKVDGENQRTIK
jgi:hypothetical protein